MRKLGTAVVVMSLVGATLALVPGIRAPIRLR